jgi:hypothetical protein
LNYEDSGMQGDEGAAMKTGDWTILPFPCASSRSNRPALRKEWLGLLPGSEAPVIVDFSGCSSLNHEDVDLLLDCMARVTGRETQLLFVAGSTVNRVFLEVTRISSLVPVFNSVEEARASLQITAENNAADQSASPLLNL